MNARLVSGNVLLFTIGNYAKRSYNNFVFKEDDYLCYSRNFSLIETFIKALVAKNVILFIGYSYNDPDTKQIFNWAKNILGDNFQRAYYIDASNAYDLHTVNYYKNLGINIIYSSEYLANTFDKQKVFENTLEMLEFIVCDDQETDMVNIAYNASKSLAELNYVLSKYALSIFKNLGVRYENGGITVHRKETEELFIKLNKDLPRLDSSKLSMIRGLLNRTIIKNVFIVDAETHKTMSICEFSGENYSEVYEYFDSLDYIAIKNYSDSVNTIGDIDNQEQLRIAYCLYKLQEYQKCYAILKKVSLCYKQQQNYVWYFICEFNRLYVGRTINNRVYFNSNKSLINEIEKIDLAELLYKNAIKGINENRFLKDLESFTLMYQTLSDVLKFYEKVEKDANTNYVNGIGVANIDILESQVKDFHNYLRYNHLMVDEYSEIKEVFRQYISAVFCSHSKKEKEFKDGFLGPGRNIVLKEISQFSVIVICKYLDVKSLNEIFENYSVHEIVLSKEAKEKVLNILDNCFSAIENKVMARHLLEKVFLILQVLGKSNIRKDDMTKIVSRLIDLMNQKLFRNTEFLDISNFIVCKINKDKSILPLEVLLGLIKAICNGYRTENWDEVDSTYINTLFRNICNIIHTEYPEARISDNHAITILEHGLVSFFPALFSIASDETKEKIKQKVISDLSGEQFDDSLYCDAVNSSIINESIEFENRLYEKVKLIHSQQTPHKKYYPDPFENVITSCINLLLNEKLIDTKKFEEYINEIPKTAYLYDLDAFDYGIFELSWFTNANKALKGKIIQNPIAFKNIKMIFKRALREKDYDQNLLQDYLEYFDNGL